MNFVEISRGIKIARYKFTGLCAGACKAVYEMMSVAENFAYK